MQIYNQLQPLSKIDIFEININFVSIFGLYSFFSHNNSYYHDFYPKTQSIFPKTAFFNYLFSFFSFPDGSDK